LIIISEVAKTDEAWQALRHENIVCPYLILRD
jgi:hypothetical protein